MVACLPMVRDTEVQSSVELYEKLKKMVLDASLLNTHYYKVPIKGKYSNPGKGVVPSPTPQWSKRKPSGRPQLWSAELLTYVYICMHTYKFIHTCTCTYIYIYIYTNIHICVCTYQHTHTCSHIYAHTHTHTHALIHAHLK